jgi:hypothetical protein
VTTPPCFSPPPPGASASCRALNTVSRESNGELIPATADGEKSAAPGQPQGFNQ